MSLPVKLWPGSDNNLSNPAKTILRNRGIDDYKEYMNLSDKALYSPYLLKNIEAAADLFIKHISSDSSVVTILVDCDVDGFTSAAILYNYIHDMEFKGTVHTLFHDKKQHGLTDDDIVVPQDTTLLVIPDAGSNDTEQCAALSDRMDILILDHHIIERENPHAVVVNSQDGEYPNKELSGAGVVWKFCQVVDDIQWTSFANKYTDLAAVGNIADVMDMHSMETKRIALKGLSQIVNPALKDYVNFNSYSIGSDEPTCIDIAFYVVPLMNALIRVGTQEQKKRLFDAMTYSTATYEYTPTRGKNKGVTSVESEGAHSAREANGCKYSQNKEKESCISALRDKISFYKWDNNKILFVNGDGIVGKELTGLVAANLATMYNRPCVLLMHDSNEKDIFVGSMRNVHGGGIENLKAFLESTECFDFVHGHENAAGVHIHKDKVPEAIAVSNKLLHDIDVKKFYVVDFTLDYEQLTIGLMRDMYAMRRVWCQGIEEPLFYIRYIPLPHPYCTTMGKTGGTWKFTDPDSYIECVCFKGGNLLDWISNDFYSNEVKIINAVCKLGMNQYGSRVTPQVIVEAYEVVENG